MKTKILTAALIFVLNSQASASRNNVEVTTDVSIHNSAILIDAVEALNNKNDIVSRVIKKGRNTLVPSEVASSDIHFTSGKTTENMNFKRLQQGRNLKAQNTFVINMVGRNKAVIDRIMAMQSHDIATMEK